MSNNLREPIKTIKNGDYKIECLSISPSGTQIISIDREYMYANDLETGNQIYKVIRAYQNEFKKVAYSPNGSFIATLSDDIMILWDTKLLNSITSNSNYFKNFNSVKHFKKFILNDQFLSVSFSKNSELIAMGNIKNNILIYNTNDCTLFKTLAHGERVISLDFSENRLVSCSKNFIKIWDYNDTSNNVISFNGHDLESVVFTPDGTNILFCTKKLIECWDSNFTKNLFKISYTKEINAMAISPDGKLIAAGTSDNYILVWDFISQNLILKGRMIIKNNSKKNNSSFQRLTSIAFSPDSRKIISGNLNSYIQIWEIPSSEIPSSEIPSSEIPLSAPSLNHLGGKKKLINLYKKPDLIKLAKKYGISLKTKTKTLKTKLQLFNSLKRKKLI
jgi:WD40 repeat protein